MLKLLLAPVALGNDSPRFINHPVGPFISLICWYNRNLFLHLFYIKCSSVDYVRPQWVPIWHLWTQISYSTLGKQAQNDKWKDEIQPFICMFRIYRENNSETYEGVNIGEITRHPAYDRRNPTTLYIHGYIEDQTSDTVVKMVRAYALRGNNNFIALNWARAASGPLYPMAVRNSYRVSKTSFKN